MLKLRRRLTVQEMADQCGISKGSLESYLRIEKPKLPGRTALVAIADNFGVSVDWLVGRSEDSFAPGSTRKEYAIGVYYVVSDLLTELAYLDAFETGPTQRTTDEGELKIANRDIAEWAARAMYDFSNFIGGTDELGKELRRDRARTYDAISSAIPTREP